jgi:hypothetical protein
MHVSPQSRVFFFFIFVVKLSSGIFISIFLSRTSYDFQWGDRAIYIMLEVDEITFIHPN